MLLNIGTFTYNFIKYEVNISQGQQNLNVDDIQQDKIELIQNLISYFSCFLKKCAY